MVKDLFDTTQKDAIVNAIKEAEKNTSGEIRVHIEERCGKNVLDRAAQVFSILDLQKTNLRNGVLFYLAVEDRKFAILGDSGINTKVPGDFWTSIKEQMQLSFKEGKFTEGLCEGIRSAGLQLKNHFPYQSDDSNELPDEISFGNN